MRSRITGLVALPVRLSVCVCLSVCNVRAPNSKTNERRKTEIGVNVPWAEVTGVSIFSLKGHGYRVRVS